MQQSNLFMYQYKIQGTVVNIIVGMHVWVEDQTEAWTDGQVTKINGDQAEILDANGKQVRCYSSDMFHIMFMLNLL